jgi:predicted kinase/GNAT superfamily N-acetyltransferase
MSSPTIRLASPEDVGAICALILRCLHQVNVRDYGVALIAEQAKNWTPDSVLARMRERITFAAAADDRVIGTAAFDGCQARSVFVSPDWHGRGVGSALMAAVEALALEKRLAHLSLQSSITAQGFYSRLGYQPLRDVLHGEERTILMTKALALPAEGPRQRRPGLAVYAMCGVAFSGKSTAARRIAAALGLPIVSLDGINGERGLDGGAGIADARWEEASFIAMARLRACLSQGDSAIVDDTFSHRFLRDRCRRVAEECGAAFAIVFLATPLAVIAARRQANAGAGTRAPIRDEVFDHHLDRFEYPGSEEPVVRVATDQDLERFLAHAAAKDASAP